MTLTCPSHVPGYFLYEYGHINLRPVRKVPPKYENDVSERNSSRTVRKQQFWSPSTSKDMTTVVTSIRPDRCSATEHVRFGSVRFGGFQNTFGSVDVRFGHFKNRVRFGSVRSDDFGRNVRFGFKIRPNRTFGRPLLMTPN